MRTWDKYGRGFGFHIATGPCHASGMYDFPLSGAQKTFLRGLGQRMEPSIKLGRGGLTPAFFAELQRHLRAQELVKLRFVGGADRDERAALCTQIADEGRCVFVGAVGHTALFYRQHPEEAERRIALPG
jgi:RNA-binding protein